MIGRVHRAASIFLGTVALAGFANGGPAQTAAQDWWAYRPLQRPAVPDVGSDAFVANDVDRFVLAGLRAAGLRPAPPASREVLIRRVAFDLLGLAPSPEAVAAFVADPAPDAYDQWIDRLLADPQYGVKWGRHWLDLVRYAETNSFERDAPKPEVWRYRDWVVDAVNRDLPWAEFLTLQLAGDERPDADVGAVTATGFCRLGLWDDEPTDPLQAIYDDLDGIADTTARAMLGMSMGCARCHDHKRDPISTRDYYSFVAFFENLQPYRPKQGSGGALSPEHFTRVVPEAGAEAAIERERAVWTQARADGRARAQALAAASYARWSPSTRVTALAAAQAALIARYRCERTDAARLLDDCGGNDGVIEGQVVPVVAVVDDGGDGGTALRFDGDDRVVLPALVSDSFTIALRVRSTVSGHGEDDDRRWYLGDGLVDADMPGDTRDFGLSWHGNGRFLAGTGAPATFLSSPAGHADGRWHHVAFTRDRAAGALALYVDGALVDTAVGNMELLDASPRLVVGDTQVAGNRGHGFRGDLDDLCIFRRALTASEVAAVAIDVRGGIAAPAVDAAVAAALDALAQLRPPVLSTRTVLCARERRGPPDASYVRLRGNANSPGDAVEPAFPAVLAAPPPTILPLPDGSSSGRRTALARWLTAPDHPLTWRVAANRIWQYHFGRGLCRSPNDFGRLGELPTHPELLDWLACEFVARGGSLKAMHRLLLHSSTYRMACVVDPTSAAIDPQNDHYWRFDRRRLEAEEVRDAMLQAAGTIDLRLGGPSVYPPLPAAVLATASRPDEAWGTSSPADAARRSLYVHQKRSLLEPLLAAFDLADTDSSCPVRFATVQPTQALMLLNGEFAQATAATLARRLATEAATPRAQLERGLWLTTQRPPSDLAIAQLLQLYERLQTEHGRDAATALQRCCLLLLNQNEFVYLD